MIINLEELKALAEGGELAVAILEDGSLGTHLVALLEEARELAAKIGTRCDQYDTVFVDCADSVGYSRRYWCAPCLARAFLARFAALADGGKEKA